MKVSTIAALGGGITIASGVPSISKPPSISVAVSVLPCVRPKSVSSSASNSGPPSGPRSLLTPVSEAMFSAICWAYGVLLALLIVSNIVVVT